MPRNRDLPPLPNWTVCPTCSTGFRPKRPRGVVQQYCSRLCNPKYGWPCSSCGVVRDAGSGRRPGLDATTYVCHSCRRMRAGRPAQPERKCFACDLPKKKSGRTCGAPECVTASRREASQRAAGTTYVGRPCKGGCGSSLRRNGPRYCEACKAAWLAARKDATAPQVKPRSSKVYVVDCTHCARTFVARNSKQHVCSDDCRIARGSARIVDLYRLATTFGDPGPAIMWRDVLHRKLRERDGDACQLCKRAIRFDLPSGPRGHASGMGASVDHIWPRSRGGSDDLDNLRLTHWKCNQARGNRIGEGVQQGLPFAA